MACLSNPSKRLEFKKQRSDVIQHLPNTNEVADQREVNALWDEVIRALHSSTKECLGNTHRKSPDWFDESAGIIQPQLAAKNRANDAHLANPSSRTLKKRWQEKRAEVQKTLREVQNEWW